MADETKDEIRADRDRLAQENAALRAQLAAGGRQAAAAPAPFILSEGQRAELEQSGVTTVDGRRATREDVEAMLTDAQPTDRVDLGSKEPADADVPQPREGATEGVDFIYPSVAPGKIDPAVAGTPGINGPAA
jgi:hypothetical protein